MMLYPEASRVRHWNDLHHLPEVGETHFWIDLFVRRLV